MFFYADFDECHAYRGICGTNGTCVNIPGSYTCQCDPGYQYSNGKCEGIENMMKLACGYIHISTQSDINECSNPTSCGTNSQCVNLPGTYRCDCNSGYTLRSGQCRGMKEIVILHVTNLIFIFNQILTSVLIQHHVVQISTASIYQAHSSATVLVDSDS